jgi:imidazolonepropionase-like amidohydrolase
VARTRTQTHFARELHRASGMDRLARGGLAALACLFAIACSQTNRNSFVRTSSSVTALTHVRVIDGTGRPAADDQTLVIQNGRITAVGRSSAVKIPQDARIRDLTGQTALPGLVGMHEHLFYQIERPGSSPLITSAPDAFAKLYLAAGVTTIRTAGTVDLAGDLRIKQQIDAEDAPGPKIDVTGPYLNAVGNAPSPEAIAHQVESAADEGATSFKAYTSLRSAELKAAIEAVHKRGLRITGHLCAVGYREAIALGIDNIEHGIIFDTDLFSGKQRDQCPTQNDLFGEVMQLNVSDAAIQQVIAELVRHGVAVTSTLAVIESYTGRDHVIDPHIPDLLASRLRGPYRAGLARWSNPNDGGARAFAQLLHLEMAFERAFVAAGGRLMAGVDPTGWGGTIAGSGDQRELELLVEAGLSPEAAIKVATLNGAGFLHKHDLGAIDRGQRADLVVVRGNPSRQIDDVRNVEMVMKDGVEYDPAALTRSVAGSIGAYDFTALLRWPANAIMALLLVVVAIYISRMGRRRARRHYRDIWSVEGLPRNDRKVS